MRMGEGAREEAAGEAEPRGHRRPRERQRGRDLGIVRPVAAGDADLSAMREPWIAARKKIVVLADVDIEEMLVIKASGGKPGEIIRRRSAEPRMSL
ncbi:hypothetical protein [Sorangium cellulosum]|uniref:hypothetical protein n=1 Tax=Sorangium sp. So ce176 TaxID=3133286 RepID=UPI0012DB21B8